MRNNVSRGIKSRIGFFPLFYNLAETGRALIIAKRYKEMGGDAIFFSHGGQYEKLAKDNGFDVVPVDPIYDEDFIEDLWKYSRLEKSGPPFSVDLLKNHVSAEIKAFKENQVDLMVSANNFPCSVSARASKIPLVSITPKVTGSFNIYPDDAKFAFTQIVPNFVKLKILNWYFPRSKIWSRPFDEVAKEYGTTRFRNSNDITKGDFTFYTDFLELVKIPSSDIKSNEFFIGPIFMDELFNHSNKKYLCEDINEHLDKKEKKILVSFGSSGKKNFFIKILNALNKTDYNIVAIYSSILKIEDLPKVKENILLKKYVPSIKELNEKTNLAIIHGGQGTIYTAAYSGKPVIGFPMQFEQHLNIETLVNKGTAILESRKYFNEKHFLNSIETIFSNYQKYLKNAKELSKSLPIPSGDKKAVEIILDILDNKT